MTASVVFHLPRNFLDSYPQQTHLTFYAKVKTLVEARGGQVRAVARPSNQFGPNASASPKDFDDGNLHIIESGCVRAPNVLNATIAYIPPFWHLSPNGVLSESGIGELTYDQATVPYRPAEDFFNGLRRRKVFKRESRYAQKSGITIVPKDCVAVFLQGSFPEAHGLAHCTTAEMLRAVAEGAGGRPVVVKPHPINSGLRDVLKVSDLISSGLDVQISDANVHDILGACCATVSFNSAVAMEGFLHRKPAILFGKSDFHHNAVTVTDPADFPNALARALDRQGGHAQYIDWYFLGNCLSLYQKEFEDKLFATFAESGFDAKRLGLN